MATRLKTIEYCFDIRTTTLNGNTRYDWSAVTVYIPETSSRVFRSAIVVVNGRSASATAQNLTGLLIGCKVGSASFSDKTIGRPWNQTGEHMSFEVWGDYTSYFETNFGSGTSQTVQISFLTTNANASTINLSGKLILTYEFSDTSATTRIKTVRIPIESITGALTTSLAEIGTNQIPQLSTFLPEASVTIRDLFFEIPVNCAQPNVTTAFQLGLQIDSEAETLMGSEDQSLISSTYNVYRWKRTDLSSSSTHAFKARSVNSGSGMANMIGAVLVVTYEYDHSTTTTLLNSILLPFHVSSWEDSTIPIKWHQHFFIEEPTTITLVQSGLLVYFNANVNQTSMAFGVGSQTPRAYTHLAGQLTCGQFAFVQRIDSGGGAGAGITIARGENTVKITAYQGAAITVPRADMIGGFVILNYTSGLHADGAEAHAHTIFHILHGLESTSVQNYYPETASAAPTIPETSWYAIAVGFVSVQHTSIAMMTKFFAELKSGEGGDDTGGWNLMRCASGINDAEELYFNGFVNALHGQDLLYPFQRYPTDPETDRMDLETARKYMVHSSIGEQVLSGYAMVVTYHSLVKTISGTIIGYTGDGSGITVDIFRVDTDEKIGEATSAVGGTYSFSWYDDTIKCYAVARQSSTRCGRSDDAEAS